MRKKILIAEASDTTRGVAENVLRQNGYEVISVANGERAMEVLELTKPSLILVDSTMVLKGKKTLFEKLQEDHRSNTIPFLLIVDEGDKSTPYPDEVLVTRPLDPQDMLSKVNVMAGTADAAASQSLPIVDDDHPLTNSVEEDMLDAALGLDRIDVTDSEVMDPSTVTKQKKKDHSVEKMIGMEHDQNNNEEEDSGKNKVESLRIDDASGEIEHKEGKSSKTGKLEILSDHEQFGIGNESLLETSDEYADHDYEWFINEMKKDVAGVGKDPKASAKSPQQQKPAAKAPSPPPPPPSPQEKGEKGAGVEKFIEEFKKEVESFSEAPSKPTAKPAPKPTTTATQPAPQAKPSAATERVSVSQMEMFNKELVQALAEKIAEKIANKLDPEKLLSLISKEIANNQKR